MAQRKSVRGPRSSLLWLAIILILVLAIALAAVVFVIGPERQLAVQATATAQAYISQATATAQAHTSEVQRAYDAGVAFATAGDWDKAAEEFAKVVALEPGYKDATARLTEARANADAARVTATAQAIAVANQAAATATAEIRSAIESAYQRGLAYFDLERWEQAKAEFEQVIAVDPDYKDVQGKMAEVEARLAEIRALTPTATLTITPGPSPTPLPTATNTPTAAPTNTPMPAPTVTPTSTPTSTSTPRPTNTPTPTPTNTRRPTKTPIPSPTPIPDTPPGTVLEMGETWYQDGVSLRLYDLWIDPDYIEFRAEFTNSTEHSLSLAASHRNFEAVNNLGQTYGTPEWLCHDPSGFSLLPNKGLVPPGETFNFCDPEHRVRIRGDTTDLGIHEVVITVNFSRIRNGRWRIPIYH